MKHHPNSNQSAPIVSAETVLEKIEPGMNIFFGTGVAEPRFLIKQIMESDRVNLQDLQLIQIVSFGEALSFRGLTSQKHRLKTFFSGSVASEAITMGTIDLIPSRFSRIPHFIKSGQIDIDVAIVQITEPNQAGYASLGVAVDVARYAMERSSLVVGEVNPHVPQTFGDTFVPISDFDLLVRSNVKPHYFKRWSVDPVFDQLGAHLASTIEDGDCLAFSVGPLFEALAPHLQNKRNLGIHSPFFTDAMMDLVNSGAVTNRNKTVFRGKSLTSYAFGTQELMLWLDRNPLIEFQGIDKVFNPLQIGLNPQFVTIVPARKMDLTGRIALHFGKGNVATGPGEAMDFFNGAERSEGGRTIFALPSRNRNGEPNIRISIRDFPNQFSMRESVNMVATEYGVANLSGRTVRERAQAIIEIAHPDDRPELVKQAKELHLIYHDQIFLEASSRLYPTQIATKNIFKGSTDVIFRAIKPSDEEEMRRLFYRFSDKAVYYRYFSPIKTMPHAKMQEYVNVDFRNALSVVGIHNGHIIAEARFARLQQLALADIAFVVDEDYQGKGIASFLYKMLIRLAKDRGFKGLVADVLASNKGMMKVFERGELPVEAHLEGGVYELSIPFDAEPSPPGRNIRYVHG